MEVKSIQVAIGAEGERIVTISASFGATHEIDADDHNVLMGILEEANGALAPDGASDEAEEEPEPAKPRRRSTTKTKDEDEPEEKPTRRRRSAKTEEPEYEDEPEEKPTRRRRSAKAEEPEDEDEPEEKPTRRRRSAAKADDKPKYPTKQDVAKAASMAAEALGSKLAAEIILEHSDTGKLDDIAEDKRQAFIDAVNFELEEDE